MANPYEQEIEEGDKSDGHLEASTVLTALQPLAERRSTVPTSPLPARSRFSPLPHVIPCPELSRSCDLIN